VRVLDALVEQVHHGCIPTYLNPAAEFVRGDVRDRAAVVRAMDGVEAVAHLAAAVGVAQSQYQIAHYADVNMHGTAVLADVLANERHAVRKTIVPGSMTAYGEGPAECSRCGRVRPRIRTAEEVERAGWEPRCPRCAGEVRPVSVSEEDLLLSESIYSISKRMQEQLLSHVGRLRGIPSIVVRLFNVFGPRQSLSNPYTGVTAIFISRLKAGSPPMVFEDGGQTRDFIWVGDVVDTMANLFETDRADGLTLNIASGQPVSVGDVAVQLANLMGSDRQPQITRQFRFGDVRHCTADIGLAASRLGFSPRTALDEGLDRLIRWGEGADSHDGFDRTMRELRSYNMLTVAS
jgi:dTDP-L-rhamnose 4-epimerase